MGLIKYGGGVVQISGKVAGNVFARNRYGDYMKSWKKPTNPSTAAQQNIRNIMAQMKDLWAALSAAQREAWETYATNTPVTNKLGDSVNLSGFNMFCRTNTALLYHGMSSESAAPTTYSLAEQDEDLTVAGDTSDQEINVGFDNSKAWASEVGGYLLLYVSRPQNPTVNYFKGPYQVLGKVAGAVVPPESPQDIATPFVIATGEKVFLQARILRADGRLSEPFRCGGLVVA